MLHEYKYEVTPEIQRSSVRDYFFTMVIGKRWIALLLLFVVGTFAALDGDSWFRNYGYVVLGLTALVLVSWIKSYIVLIRMADSHYEMLENGLITLSLDDKGIHYNSTNTDKFIPWVKLTVVKESKNGVFLMRGKVPMVNIPKKMIDSEGLRILKILNSGESRL